MKEKSELELRENFSCIPADRPQNMISLIRKIRYDYNTNFILFVFTNLSLTILEINKKKLLKTEFPKTI